MLSNSYVALPERFYRRIDPTPVARPRLLLWNALLAADLGISVPEDEATVGEWFAGNLEMPGAQAIALAYAGHQFGHFVPQLGDGRAHLLGEVQDRAGRSMDVQLKGSGPTPFSRGGDGRCALGPAIREFIMSEAMHALGVPTTRCLAVVSTGEVVRRERPLPGAIVTRIAASHLRVGTFQYFAARGDDEALKALLDYAIDRHYPELAEASDRAAAFVRAVARRQIDLVVEWMRVGFIHGVMNTDNTAISGETIDYGPCAMLGAYDPATVYSSIDRHGRYAFGNQANIAGWNVARLGECLLPTAEVDAIASDFPQQFEESWFAMMEKKVGSSERDRIREVLHRLEEERRDYTLAFQEMDGAREANPVVIPRNHHVERVLAAALEGDLEPTRRMLEVLRSPYQERPETAEYQDVPADGDAGYRTFCGT